MVAGFLLLIIGVVFGACLRLPAFMEVAVVILVIYGWTLRHHSVEAVIYNLLIGLLAIQCGYALTIVGRLLLKVGTRRFGSAANNSEK